MSTPKIDRSDVLHQKMLQNFRKPAAPEGQREAGVLRETPATGGLVGANGEKLEISASARRLEEMRDLLAAGRRALEDVPDVRADRVAAAKQKVTIGAYEDPKVRLRVAADLTAVSQRLDKLLG